MPPELGKRHAPTLQPRKSAAEAVGTEGLQSLEDQLPAKALAPCALQDLGVSRIDSVDSHMLTASGQATDKFDM